MTYFPKIDERPALPEKCPGCGEWYISRPDGIGTSCLVLHSSGTCCHHGETKVEDMGVEVHGERVCRHPKLGCRGSCRGEYACND